MAEILFSNLNLSPKDIFMASSSALADKATDLAYDGIEFTTVYSRAMYDLKKGKDISAIAALHESFPFSTELDTKRWKSIAKNIGYACVMPPSTASETLASVVHMEELAALQEPIPAVLYPHRGGDADIDRAKRDRFLEASFQPTAEVMEAWQVTDGLDFLDQAKRRELLICVDTFHALRKSRRTGNPPIHWSSWLPYAAAQGKIERIHLAAYRSDFAKTDPAAVVQNNQEIDALLFDHQITGELKDMVDIMKSLGTAATAITIELPYSGALDSLIRHGFSPNQANADGIYIDMADAARDLLR